MLIRCIPNITFRVGFDVYKQKGEEAGRSKTVHQTEQVPEEFAYHYRIRSHDSYKVLLTSRARPGKKY